MFYKFTFCAGIVLLMGCSSSVQRINFENDDCFLAGQQKILKNDLFIMKVARGEKKWLALVPPGERRHSYEAPDYIINYELYENKLNWSYSYKYGFDSSYFSGQVRVNYPDVTSDVIEKIKNSSIDELSVILDKYPIVNNRFKDIYCCEVDGVLNKGAQIIFEYAEKESGYSFWIASTYENYHYWGRLYNKGGVLVDLTPVYGMDCHKFFYSKK